MMRKTTMTTAILSLILWSAIASAGPDYASNETKRVIEAMVDAHGGIERWRAAPSIRFDDIMHNPYHEKKSVCVVGGA